MGMRKTGRPKRKDQQEDRERLCKQGEALRQYRESQHCADLVLRETRFDESRRHPYPSREEFGKYYGFSKSTAQRYEEGKTPLPDDIAKAIEKETSIVAEHWQGYVERMNPKEYLSYLRDRQNLEDGMTAYYEELESRIREREQFFSCIGFKYSYEEPTAAQDFGFEPFWGSHTLINYSDSSKPYHFTDDELTKLMEKIESAVGFACYEKDIHK